MQEMREKRWGLGAHNAMTAERPLQWWARAALFAVRCQREKVETLYEKGVRMFDLRLRLDRRGRWRFAHGRVMFQRDPEEVMAWLDERGDCLVRVVLEYNRAPRNAEAVTEAFRELMERWRTAYPWVRQFEFRRKWDWKKAYTYATEPEPDIYQAVSSMTGTIIDDWCPWLYARTHNRDILAQGTDHEWLMMDFIDSPR